MAKKPDRTALLEDLDPIAYDKDEDRGMEQLAHLSLGNALLVLAEIDHGREYELCRSLAAHLLGSVPEPDDIDTGEE